MNIRYRVTLTEEERAQLATLVQGGKGAVRRIKRAQILLAADAGGTDERIAANVSVGTSTVYRTKRRFVEEGLEQALSEEPRPGADRKLSTTEEAMLVATACSKAPAGRARWTLSLLAGEMVRLTKHRSHLVGDDPSTARREGAQAVAEEDVVHPEGRRRIRRPDGGRARALRRGARREPPGRVLRRDAATAHRRSASAGRGQAGKDRARVDYEYVRNGTANVFMFVDAHRPWRHAKVTDQRANRDFAECMRDLVDEHYPSADRIRVVLDNLSTHKPAALYEAFAPAEARRILRRLEFHYTPKHASWLNMVEIEIGVMVAQCLDRRIADKATLAPRSQWERRRNAERARIKWLFTVERARVKLGRSYPPVSQDGPLRAAA